MKTNEMTKGQFGDIIAKFAQKFPLDADKDKVQKALDDKNHPLWKIIATCFIAVTTILREVMTIACEAIQGKKTKDCFTDKKRYYYRDGDLDSWLLKEQGEEKGGSFKVFGLERTATFKDTVKEFLGEQSDDIAVLSKILRDRGHTTTPTRIEDLIERQEKGEDVGLRTDGWANFFFVEGKDDEVFVVSAYRCGDSQWYVSVFSLGIGDRWSAGYRFFLRKAL